LDLEADLESVPVSSQGSLFAAVRGHGCWFVPDSQDFSNLAPISVSDRRDVRRAIVVRSFEAGHTNTGQLEEIVKELDIRVEPLRVDSQVKYALLAAGKGDIMLRLLSSKAPDYREKIWDHAAGSLILEEAGGVVSDLSGNPLDFTVGRRLERNRGILASNKMFHEIVLEAIRRCGQ
jgi:3'(2'), 5'-bisphosphate nucleotidase